MMAARPRISSVDGTLFAELIKHCINANTAFPKEESTPAETVLAGSSCCDPVESACNGDGDAAHESRQRYRIALAAGGLNVEEPEGPEDLSHESLLAELTAIQEEGRGSWAAVRRYVQLHSFLACTHFSSPPSRKKGKRKGKEKDLHALPPRKPHKQAGSKRLRFVLCVWLTLVAA